MFTNTISVLVLTNLLFFLVVVLPRITKLSISTKIVFFSIIFIVAIYENISNIEFISIKFVQKKFTLCLSC
jgi:hypothetical protein